NHREGINRNWDQDDKAEDVAASSVVSEEVLRNRVMKKSKEDSFLDLVKALEFNLHKDCQMERAVISAPSLNSPKTGTWTKVAFDSITSKGEKKSSNPKTNGPFSCLYWDKAYQWNASNKKLATLNMGTVAVIMIEMELTKCWLKHSLFPYLVETNYNKNHHFCYMTAKLKLHLKRKLVKLWPPDWIFIFPWQTSFFGKNIPQSKPVSSPFFTKILVSQAENGRNECKGRDKGRDDEPPKIVITQVKGDAFYSKNYKLFYKKMNLKRRV
ncbi:hypothetical protein EI555_015850, partial [Monodon monoceros]